MTFTRMQSPPGRPTLQPLQGKQRRFLGKLSLVIAGGMFIDGFILGGIGVVMPSITEDLQLSAAWQGLIGASALIGIFFGGPLGGYLADKVGRKPMFTFTLAVFLIGSVAQFFIADAAMLFFVRLLMGMAIGADYAIGWPLLAEFAPARLRGKLLAIQEVAWYVGYLFSYAMGYALVSSITIDWQIVLGLSTIPSVIVFLMRLGTPESPRWLMSKGRTKEAEAIAAEFMTEEEQRDLREEKVRKSSFRLLFSPEHIKTTTFVSVFWICNVTPYFAIATFAPVVLTQFGLKDGLTGALALNGIVVLGSMASVLLIERVGRRKLAIPPFWISAAALLLVALFAGASPTVVILCFLVFSFFNAVSTALTGVYPGEVFPTEIRGAGVGFATAASRIGAAVGTFVLPVSMEGLGVATTMVFAAAVSIIGGVVSHFLAPETKGLVLSEASGGSNRK
ncbi:MFS transporter [Arthrobacter crystallopoietes]|uniref:MFS transporter, putative metabolite transport protein n=1 Tax=Crystallibacter crystallopoietes TaxID=37928 RepID=A0A1H1BZI7_9MICC|nr:MFS transporter [Arthrobacter crystallopoietes]SDQ57190.1 MFS transporter, putative metabolite transport protein [Arthrobacter crystallopoietes]